MNALENVLTLKLLERLREEEGGVYGTGASASISKFPKGRFSFQINFGTGIEKYELLTKLALEEIAKIKKNGPLQSDLDKFKIEQKRQMELSVKENSFWAGYISSTYELQEPLRDPNVYLQQIDNVSVKSVQKIAQKYLNDEHLFQFILLPDGEK